MKKYFVTSDLEKTLPWAIWEKNKILIPNEFRDKTTKLLDNSFWWKITEFINYDSIKDFFWSLRRNDEFLVTLDDEIYIENPDFNYSSTRKYRNPESILNNPTDYQITGRDGKSLSNQNSNLIEKIINSWKEEIVFCDDGLFSWDTLTGVINNIKKLWINIKEIRVILNFSWKNKINGIPIISMYNITDCIDWIDERDFFYWTKNSWASFNYNWQINGIPYISSKEIAVKKASIPEKKSKNFVEDMFELNKDVWDYLQSIQKKVFTLSDIQRIAYLQDKYPKNTDILSVLEAEKTIFNF